MKDKAILMAILMMGIISPCFAYGDFDGPLQPEAKNSKGQVVRPQKPSKEEMERRRAEFDKRLNLSEEQKVKAKQLREQGQKQMKPVMDAMEAKRKELKASKAAKSNQEEIKKIQSDMKELDKKAHQLRMNNMKEFEAILNQNQLNELNKMKEEGRKKFNSEHKNKPPQRFGINPPPPPQKEAR